MPDADLTAWWWGYAAAGVVLVVVVIVVGTILALAKRIRDQARTVTATLERIRDNTDGLWELQEMNLNLDAIVTKAGDARETLGR